jgi:hypothetical protein
LRHKFTFDSPARAPRTCKVHELAALLGIRTQFRGMDYGSVAVDDLLLVVNFVTAVFAFRSTFFGGRIKK